MNGKQVTGEVGASDLRDGGREDADEPSERKINEIKSHPHLTAVGRCPFCNAVDFSGARVL